MPGERLYRLCLRLYPIEFRDEFGDSMLAFYRERWHEAGASSQHRRTRFWLSVFGDVIAGAIGEQLTRVRRRLAAPNKLHTAPTSAPMTSLSRQHITYAVRRLRRTPAFTITAVVMLALGIGISTGLFSAIDALLLRPLPYGDADRLVAISPSGPGSATSKASFERLGERQRAFGGIAGYSRWGFMTTTADGAELLQGAVGTANLFAVLDARPLIGATFATNDDRPGRTPVAVLGYQYWTREWAASRGVVGRTIMLNGVAHTIIGVMPREFNFPAPDIDLWTPAVIDPADRFDYSGAGYLLLVGRLRPDESLARAAIDLRTAMTRVRDAFPGSYSSAYGDVASVTSLRDAMLGSTRLVLLLLFGAVGFVLLITCANVGNLVLVRASTTTHELAVRAALGARRSELIAQILVEMVLLALVGGAGGLVIAAATIRAVASLLPADLLGVATIGMNARVLLFTGTLSALVGIAFGIAPAVRLSRDPLLANRLRDGARALMGPPGARKAMSTLLVAQFTTALVLAIGAGLMVQTVWQLATENPGFSADGTLAFSVVLPAGRQTAERQIAFYEQLEQELARSPGASVGSATPLPFSGSNNTPALSIEGRPDDPSQRPAVDWRRVSPGYFSTMRIPLVRGRLFTRADRLGAPPVALVNETLVRQQFPSTDPIGRRIRTVLDEEAAWVTIVGVVRDTKVTDLLNAAPPQVFRPVMQRPVSFAGFVLRLGADATTAAQVARRAVRAVDRDAVLMTVRPLDRMVSGSFDQRRVFAIILGVFASLAIILTTTGVFGLAAYRVAQSRREMALRMALGARPVDVVRTVVTDTFRLVGAGLGIGIAVAVGTTRLVASQLYGVPAIDPMTFALATLLLAGAALVATLVPARRSARLDPAEILRNA